LRTGINTKKIVLGISPGQFEKTLTGS